MKMSVFSKTYELNTPTHPGLQMSDTVPGPFFLFRCAEPKPSALRSCAITRAAGCLQAKWASCLRDACGDGQGKNW